MDIYVANINFQATEDDLRTLFENYGGVDSVKIIIDRATGRSRGFGFVTMPDTAEAMAAMEVLDGSEWMGRPSRISEARPREPREERRQE